MIRSFTDFGCASILFSLAFFMKAAEVPRPEYPEPQFMRASWMSLNGSWDFAFDDANQGSAQHWDMSPLPHSMKINVPYCFESKLSGIQDTGFHPVFWYRRSFAVPREKAWTGKNILLHFGAVDFRASVWLNNHFLGEHEGGGVPISFDISSSIRQGSNLLTLRVEDPPTDKSIPRGKQFWEKKSKSIFYTRTSGIWQPVWIEATAKTHLDYVHVTATQDGSAVFHGGLNAHPSHPLHVSIELANQGVLVAHEDVVTTEDRFDAALKVDSPQLWSPDSPTLYDLRYTLSEGDQVLDRVQSYVGFRTIGLEGNRVTINGKPCYLKLLLDQGHWPESILTPPSDAAILKDIELITAMGFNGVRKHQKIADPRFLYWADKRGLLVSGEIADAQEFDSEAARRTTAEWLAELKRDYNHPSIIIWNAINESWGVPKLNDKDQQAYLKALYWITKSLDQTRFMIDNEGWMHTDDTDLFAIHDYTKSGEELYQKYRDVTPQSTSIPKNGRDALISGYRYNGSPLYLSEFGGIAFIPVGTQASGDSWGYSGVEKTQEAAFARLSQLFDGVAKLPNLVGFCYTQLTDVEQEVNGLLTYDRKPKFEVAQVKALNDKFK